MSVDGTALEPNPYSWNKNASMVYIDNPAGVGYSFLNDSDNAYFTDMSTSEDALTAIIAFYSKFPSLK